jgi:hypothetical protein
VGWLFASDLHAASTAVLTVAVGGVALSLSESPPWLLPFLGGLGARFRRVGELVPERTVQALHEASLSPDARRRAGAERARRGVEGPPWSLPELGFVRAAHGVRAGFGPQLLAVRQVPRAAEAIALCVAAHVDPPDVLVVDPTLSCGPGLVDWLRARIESDDATLEQVFLPEDLA